MEPTQVKNCLAELREEKSWSQGDLAEKLCVSRQTINSLERGKYDPSLPLAFKIAQLFSRTIEEIFEPDKQPVRPEK
jgi:putative transcriptional regulator